MGKPRSDGSIVAGWNCRLAIVVIAPVYGAAVIAQAAAVFAAGGDGDKRPVRRVGLAFVGVAVGAPANSDAVGIQAAGVLAAGGYGGIAGGDGQLGGGSRRRLWRG